MPESDANGGVGEVDVDGILAKTFQEVEKRILPHDRKRALFSEDGPTEWFLNSVRRWIAAMLADEAPRTEGNTSLVPACEGAPMGKRKRERRPRRSVPVDSKPILLTTVQHDSEDERYNMPSLVDSSSEDE